MGLLEFIFKQLSSKTYEDEKGYKRFKDSGILEHRWAAEKKLGRKLKKGEVVHHKNRDKTNNLPHNLQVFKNQEEHSKQHILDAKKFGKKASYQGFQKKKKSFWDLF